MISLDLGPSGSPVADGYNPVAPASYSPSTGYGWASLAGINSRDRGGPDPLRRDFHFGRDGTFLADLPVGTYDVTLTMGDAAFAHDLVGVWMEGRQVDPNVTTTIGQFERRTYRTGVEDGQLTIRLASQGGTDPNFVLNAIEIIAATGTEIKPVISVPSGLRLELVIPASVHEGADAIFTTVVSGGAGNYQFAWDLDGDGIFERWTPQPTVSASFPDNGVFNVGVRVVDGSGQMATAEGLVAVANVAPVVTLGRISSAPEGEAVRLSALVTDPSPVDSASGFIYAWNFGDGSDLLVGAGISEATHQYSSAGSYTVKLTVTDKDGGSSTVSSTAIVHGADDPLFKPVLDQSDFSYVGSFRMPRRANGWSTAFSTGGLTHRYVDGELRFLTTSHVYSGGLVYETNFPGLGVEGSYPVAEVVHEWGDVYSGQKWVDNNGGTAKLTSGNKTYGLHYDQDRERLYWNYGHWYNTTNPHNPSMGYSELNDLTGIATGVASWALQDRPEKFARGGTLRIPEWFADRYTDGKSLGVGFGGYFSIVSSASFGPALAAVADPDPSINSSRSALENVPLIGYPHGAPERAHRNPDYTSRYDGGAWNPEGETGYWTWSDSIYGGGTWIDAPGLGGVLFIAKVGQGNVWYENSDRRSEAGAFEWYVYAPEDLAAVASGQKQQWEIQPRHSWIESTLPMGGNDASGYSGDGASQVGGITFDAETNRLYVLVNSSYRYNVERYPQIYVYELNTSESSTQESVVPVAGAMNTVPVTNSDANGSASIANVRSPSAYFLSLALIGLLDEADAESDERLMKSRWEVDELLNM